MKLKNILMTAVVALTTVASVNAATTSYSDGDLLLGIRKVGATSDYLVDLGQASNFDFSKNISFAVSGIAADLQATWGTGWHSDSTITYSVFGTVNATDLVYTTNPTATAFPVSFDQSSVTLAIGNIGANSYDGKASTTNNTVGIWQTVGSNYSYGSYQPGGTNSGNISFATWDSNEAAVSSKLNFDILNEGGPATTEPGTFSLGTDGSLSYQAVPEPSTYAMVGLGALGMLVMLRRRSVQA